VRHSERQVIAKIESLRRQYAKGRLSPEQIAKLESIEGWRWSGAIKKPNLKNEFRCPVCGMVAFAHSSHADGTDTMTGTETYHHNRKGSVYPAPDFITCTVPPRPRTAAELRFRAKFQKAREVA
jgi:hypothetical protein